MYLANFNVQSVPIVVVLWPPYPSIRAFLSALKPWTNQHRVFYSIAGGIVPWQAQPVACCWVGIIDLTCCQWALSLKYFSAFLARHTYSSFHFWHYLRVSTSSAFTLNAIANREPNGIANSDDSINLTTTSYSSPRFDFTLGLEQSILTIAHIPYSWFACCAQGAVATAISKSYPAYLGSRYLLASRRSRNYNPHTRLRERRKALSFLIWH